MDLWVEISLFSTNRNFDIHLGNDGNRPAYDVEVEIERAGPAFVWNSIALPDGTCLKDDKGGNCLTVKSSGFISTSTTLFWNIPLLEAGEELELSITSQNFSGNIATQYDVAVTSASWEKETRLHDNSHRIWVGWFGGQTNLAEPDYSVEVRVDDRRPSAGDTVNFAVFAKNHNYGTGIRRYRRRLREHPADLWPHRHRNPDPRQASRATLSPIGSGNHHRPFLRHQHHRRHQGVRRQERRRRVLPAARCLRDYLSIMTLPVTIASGAAVGEQCLTAEIFATPPTGSAHALDDPTDNRVTYCLEYPPVGQAFDEGEVSVMGGPRLQVRDGLRAGRQRYR